MAWAFFLLTYFGGGHNHCDDDAREYRWINSSVYSMSGAYPGSSACRTSIEYTTGTSTLDVFWLFSKHEVWH